MADRTTWLIVAGVACLLLLIVVGPWFLFAIPWMAMGAVGFLFVGAFAIPLLLLVCGIFVVAYLAYRARVAREEAPAQALMAGQDPADELAEINDELERLASEASASLERTRRTMDEGLRG